MTPAAWQSGALALAAAAWLVLCAVLALCASAALVQAAVSSFLTWRADLYYRRAFREAARAADKAPPIVPVDYMRGLEVERPSGALCDVPPAGWRCTRARGHAGPCAGVPIA